MIKGYHCMHHEALHGTDMMKTPSGEMSGLAPLAPMAVVPVMTNLFCAVQMAELVAGGTTRHHEAAAIVVVQTSPIFLGTAYCTDLTHLVVKCSGCLCPYTVSTLRTTRAAPLWQVLSCLGETELMNMKDASYHRLLRCLPWLAPSRTC